MSAVANIAEGFQALHGQPLTTSTISQLDPLQAIIGLLATGLISLIVLALSEIAGTDVSTAIRKAEREAKRAEQAAAPPPQEPAPKPAQAEQEPAESGVVCDVCERPFATQQALNAHKRFCMPAEVAVPVNGNGIAK